MIILINIDKAFDKIQHPLIKTFNKTGTEVPHIIKTSSDKPSANISQWWKTDSFSSKMRTKGKMPHHCYSP